MMMEARDAIRAILKSFRDVWGWTWENDRVHGGVILTVYMMGGEQVHIHFRSERTFALLTEAQQRAWLYDRIVDGLEDRKHGII